MEIFQTIWTALSTPNQLLVDILGIPFTFVEIYLYSLLFTTILNITYTKKQQLLYVVLFSFTTLIINSFVPKIYTSFVLIIICPIYIICIFKTNILKAIIAEFLPLLITVILELIISKIYSLFVDISYESAAIIPIYREGIVLTTYVCIYIIYNFAKYFKFRIFMLDSIDKKTKNLLILNSLLGCISIASQFYIMGYYNGILPLFIIFLSLLCLITYFITSLYSINRTTQLQITTQNLEEAQLYNKSLKILHDNVRAFKHDFSNIVQAIGRLCWN